MLDDKDGFESPQAEARRLKNNWVRRMKRLEVQMKRVDDGLCACPTCKRFARIDAAKKANNA